MKTGIITDLDVQRRIQDHLHTHCELAENDLKSGRPSPTQQADQTRAGDLIQSSKSRSVRALRAACSSASRAATLAACWVARLLDYLVDRGGEVLMQFLSRAGDGGGRDREVSCWPGARTHSARPVVS